MPDPSKRRRGLLLAALIAAWAGTLALYATGVWPYPWGWLLLFALIAWAASRLRGP